MADGSSSAEEQLTRRQYQEEQRHKTPKALHHSARTLSHPLNHFAPPPEIGSRARTHLPLPHGKEAKGTPRITARASILRSGRRRRRTTPSEGSQSNGSGVRTGRGQYSVLLLPASILTLILTHHRLIAQSQLSSARRSRALSHSSCPSPAYALLFATKHQGAPLFLARPIASLSTCCITPLTRPYPRPASGGSVDRFAYPL